MSRLPNKFFILMLCAIAHISCEYIEKHIDIYDYVNLDAIGIITEPALTNSVLPETYSPVIIKFDTEMKKRESEGILQIASDLGTVQGDKFWKDNDLYFVPISGWTAGIRYNMNLTGSVYSIDGREARIDRYVSFYAVNNNAPPLLERHLPLNGESTGTNNVVLEFYFSHSMDRQSTEAAIIAEGVGNKTLEWSDDNKTIKLIPEKPLSPWKFYRWNLKDTAKCIDGVPLPKNYSGYFISNLDQTLPVVVDIYPVLFSGGIWFPAGTDLKNGLGYGQGIAVSFNKPMGDSVLRSLRFDPSLSGRTERHCENSIVYILTGDPNREIVYTLTVSGDTRDNEGLKIGSDFKINFTADIPFLNIISFTVNENTITKNFLINNSAIPVTPAPETGELSFSIRFSLPFTAEEKQNVPLKINLTPFFPRTLSPVALEDVYWISNDRLYMRWENLTALNGYTPHYYKLTIPGGKSGIYSDKGIYMKENIILYLEVVK